MNKIDKQLFPDEVDWLDGSFKNITEMFGSFEHLARYIKKRFPNSYDTQIENYRGTFIIEEVDVVFIDPKKNPRRIINLGFAENKMTIKIPDSMTFSNDDREELRDKYQIKYTSIVKESHIRAMTLLWKLLGDEAREELKKELE